MQVRHLFFVDGCSLNRRPLRIIISLGVKDLARVVSHRADSAGPPLSPPVFFRSHSELILDSAPRDIFRLEKWRKLCESFSWVSVFNKQLGVLLALLVSKPVRISDHDGDFFSGHRAF